MFVRVCWRVEAVHECRRRIDFLQLRRLHFLQQSTFNNPVRCEGSWHLLFSTPSDFDFISKRREVVLSLCEGNELKDAIAFLFQTCTFAHKHVYLSLLKACIIKKSLDLVMLLYFHIILHAAELTGLLGDFLVVTLAKCGGIDDAYHISQTLSRCTVFSWTAMISACVDYGRFHDSLKMYESMLENEVEPNEYTFASLFKACGILRDLSKGKSFHDEACNTLTSLGFLVNTLVNMYGKCGAIADAENVFCSFSLGSVVSWNSMMSVYIEQSQGEKVLLLLRQMLEHSVNLDHLTVVSVLQACGIIAGKDDGSSMLNKEACLEIGQALHAYAYRNGFMDNVYIGTTLVNMYSKCDMLPAAVAVFTKMSEHSSVAWNAMLSAHVEHQKGFEALQLFRHMQMEGVSPDHFSIATVLKACYILLEAQINLNGSSLKVACLKIGQAIFADAERLGFPSDVFVCTTLLSIYGKCGEALEAERIFSAMLQPSIVSWTAMLSAYVNADKGATALLLYRQMLAEGTSPDEQAFVVSIQACGKINLMHEEIISGRESLRVMSCDIVKGLHIDSIRMGFGSDVFIGSSLVSLYGKLGNLRDAEHVFQGLCKHSIICWTAMLTAYVDWSLSEKALQLYQHMQKQGVSPDQQIFLIVIQACGGLLEKKLGDDLVPLEILQVLHKDVIMKGYAADIYIGSALVTNYGKCGAIQEAESLFGSFSQYNVISWTAMLTTRFEQGLGEEVLMLFRTMQDENLDPDEVIFATVISACGILKEEFSAPIPSTRSVSLLIGQALHADARKRGFMKNTEVCNALINMYGTCGSIVNAEHVFETLQHPDVTCWNCMLSAYARNGLGKKALQLYRYMLEGNTVPDTLSMITALQACNNLDLNVDRMDGSSYKTLVLEIIKALHSDAFGMGFTSDIMAANTLVSTYGKSGTIVEAENVFNGISHGIVSSWNAMISTYIKQGQEENAFELYRKMRSQHVMSDDVTYICILQAINKTGSFKSCQDLHFEIVSSGLDLNLSIVATLIHAYGCCSSMSDANSVHDGVSFPHLASDTAVIDGFANQGSYVNCIKSFANLQLANIKIDATVFTALLSACSRAGLLVEGLIFFEAMMKDYDITPDVMHYGNLVDLLGRAGTFSRITNLMAQIPSQMEPAIWTSLLAACSVHGNAQLGEQAFCNVIYCQPNQVSAYVVMSNIAYRDQP